MAPDPFALPAPGAMHPSDDSATAPIRRLLADRPSRAASFRLPDGQRRERLVAAAVILLGVAVLGVAWWRSQRPATVGRPAHAATVSTTRAAWSTPGAGPDGSAGADSAATPDPAAWRVHVSGGVVRPGVYVVHKGDRVAEAITAAGGAVPGVDVHRINLAARVADGAEVHVPVPGEPAPAVPAGSSGSGTPAGDPAAPVDLNAAGVEALDALPGVGHATAEAIVRWRDAHGPFRSPKDLDKVPGLGPGKIARLADRVTT